MGRQEVVGAAQCVECEENRRRPRGRGPCGRGLFELLPLYQPDTDVEIPEMILANQERDRTRDLSLC